MPGIFDKLVGEVKSRAKAISEGNKQTDSLGNELAERAKMTRNALGNAETPDKPAEAAVAGDRLNSGRKYGDRPGEKRIDTREMVKPLGQSLPVFDKGGKVKKSKVNVGDGKHHVAILKEGERVLTEKQNKKYEKSEAFDKENPAEDAMEAKIYDKGGKVTATPYDMVSAPKKAPKTIQKHEYHRTHNGKHVVTHKHHDPSHKDEQHMFEKFSDAANHMEQNPPQPEQEMPEAAPAAGAPAAAAAPAM
jgi:hypothetical protein